MEKLEFLVVFVTIYGIITIGLDAIPPWLLRGLISEVKRIVFYCCGGLTALPPRGGPWKLGSGLGQNPEANTALGVGWGAPAVELFES